MTQQNLFETEVSISPMKAFLKKHKIETQQKYKGMWIAFAQEKGMVSYFDTEKDAIYELVKHYDIGNWKELNWD